MVDAPIHEMTVTAGFLQPPASMAYLRTVRNLGAGTAPQFPVQRWRRILGRGIAQAGLVVDLGIHLHQFADSTRLDEFGRRDIAALCRR